MWNVPTPCNKLTGQYGGPRKEGHQGGGERLPIFPNCLWGGTTGLPLEAHGVLMYPLQLLMGNMSLVTLLAISPQPSYHNAGTHSLQPPTQPHWQCPHPLQESNSNAIEPKHSDLNAEG